MDTPRVRVKICGLTNPEDAHAAVSFGADALGFNTWAGSSRYLDLASSEPWLRDLPPFVTRVALTVNAPLEEARRVAGFGYIDAVQLHGDEDLAYAEAVAAEGRPVIKALRLGSREDLAAAADFTRHGLLLDARVEGAFGGTGVPVALELVQEFRRRFPERPLILAGGLRPETVAAAVSAVRPYAVDVSSGVESKPGRKDHGLMKAFLEAVRNAG